MSDFSLSIILPNFNHGRYLAELLDSMLAQLPYFEEIIVVDDASTDNSAEIVKKYAEKYPVIRLVRNEKNLGVVLALKEGLKYAKGDYVFLPAADDKILPGFFRKFAETLTRYPEAGLCCCDSFTVKGSQAGRIVNKRNLGGAACYIPSGKLIGIMRRKIVYLSGFGTVFKKQELLRTGFFPEFLWSADRMYATVIALRCGLCYVPEPLVVYHYHEGSYSVKGLQDRKKHEEVLGNIFTTLKDPRYSDVLPKLKRSCALASLHLAGLRVLAANAKYWEYVSPNLVRLVLWDEFKNAVGGYTPLAIKKAYRALRAQAGGE